MIRTQTSTKYKTSLAIDSWISIRSSSNVLNKITDMDAVNILIEHFLLWFCLCLIFCGTYAQGEPLAICSLFKVIYTNCYLGLGLFQCINPQ